MPRYQNKWVECMQELMEQAKRVPDRWEDMGGWGLHVEFCLLKQPHIQPNGDPGSIDVVAHWGPASTKGETFPLQWASSQLSTNPLIAEFGTPSRFTSLILTWN